MKKRKQKPIIYYNDEINDDFAGTKINTRRVGADFRFVHKNLLWRACSAFLYYLIAYPIVWFYERVILRVKVVNRGAMKHLKNTPGFIYGNHTGFIDAFTPNVLSLPYRRNRIIVGPDSVSIPGITGIVQMMGAIPLPTELRGMRAFSRAVDYYHNSSNITIYPEAHIWHYYCGVRPFSDASFVYPVKYDAPVVAFFTAYSKPKGFLSFMRKANVTVYVSDPIYPDPSLTPKERQTALRDRVYEFMKEKSALSDYEVIRYEKREERSAQPVREKQIS